jgi:hypothetical protein
LGQRVGTVLPSLALPGWGTSPLSPNDPDKIVQPYKPNLCELAREIELQNTDTGEYIPRNRLDHYYWPAL